MRHAEQKRVFGMVPGLENAEFLRYGTVHRNTFLDSPRLLDEAMALRTAPQLRFAGQITGVEGYVESSACGLWVGLKLAADLQGQPLARPPVTTALGALLNHVTDDSVPEFQPSNVHFGLMPALEKVEGQKRLGKSDRKAAHAERARIDLAQWVTENKQQLLKRV